MEATEIVAGKGPQTLPRKKIVKTTRRSLSSSPR